MLPNASYLILNFCTRTWAKKELSLENWQRSKLCHLNRNVRGGKEYEKIYVHENKALKFIILRQSLCKKCLVGKTGNQRNMH